MRKITAIVLGAGSRGHAYSEYSLSCPEELEIVGVAEPDEKKGALQSHLMCFAAEQSRLEHRAIPMSEMERE